MPIGRRGHIAASGRVTGDESATTMLAIDPPSEQPDADPQGAATNRAGLMVADPILGWLAVIWMVHWASPVGDRNAAENGRHTGPAKT